MRKKISVLLLSIILCATAAATPFMQPSPAVVQAKAVRLRVKGNHLVDPKGKTKMLKGVSTHGLAWYPQYVNKKAFKTLRDKWGVNTIRLAMYTEEYGGYCAGGDKKALKKKIDEGVKYATSLGMYVIIDWHILNDNDPTKHQKAAKKFFTAMAKKYKGHTNVLYEICNEPHGASWHKRIKPYANKIIKAIRKYLILRSLAHALNCNKSMNCCN